MSNTLIKNLQDPALYDHAIKEFKVYETHSSIVLTTGEYVYKIKKPVNFGFLDYSSLDKRQYHCQREIALNSKLAPAIYLSVVAIYGDEQHPSFQANGEAFEYAVKMRQFPQQNIFSQLLAQDQLTKQSIENLAEVIAKFHNNIDTADDSVFYGTPEHIHKFAIDNFTDTLPLLKIPQDIEQLKTLQEKTETNFENIKQYLHQRKEQGKVRHCHGDMHLNNIVLIDQKPIIFDCIEFNEDFIWTDVMGDLGFIIMDLDEHNKPELARLLLNRYLEVTGDYSALFVLPYFCAYRAMVRAKVDQLRLTQPGLSETDQQQISQHYHQCLQLVSNYFKIKQPELIITHGFCASGKSTAARQLVAEMGAIQLRSDVERKRLAGLDLTADSKSALYEGLYTPEITDKVYLHLADLATQIISAGYSVVIDAAFIRHDLRTVFAKLAEKLNVPFKILNCEVPEAELRQRIIKRDQKQDKITEGRLEILEHQLQHHDPLTADELLHSINKSELKLA